MWFCLIVRIPLNHGFTISNNQTTQKEERYHQKTSYMPPSINLTELTFLVHLYSDNFKNFGNKDDFPVAKNLFQSMTCNKSINITVLVVGANYGQAIANIAQVCMHFKIYGFEGSPVIFEKLQQKFSNNQNIEIINSIVSIDNVSKIFRSDGTGGGVYGVKTMYSSFHDLFDIFNMKTQLSKH